VVKREINVSALTQLSRVNQEMERKLKGRARALKRECEGKRARFWTTEISEEKETVEIQVFRCTLCGHTCRERG
jgi:DNA-directed RNA polymerase subunit M/transcription elongation factor TFIIS